MASPSRIRERTAARSIAFAEIDLERERQSQRYDYDDDVAAGEGAMLDVALRFIDAYRIGGQNRRDLIKAGAMIVAALEVDTDTARLG